MESSNLILWVRLGFGLIIGLIFTCVLYTICEIRQDIATAGDDIVIPIYQSRSATTRSRNRLAFSENKSRTIPREEISARYV